MDVNVKLLYEDSKLPRKGRIDDAGFDCFVHHKEYDSKTDTTYLCLGFSIEIPYGYVGILVPRSGMNKTRLYVPASVGIIDPNYRGELRFVYKHPSNTVFNPVIGESYCQLLIIKNENIALLEKLELSATERGTQGFNSSGNNSLAN